MPMSATMTQYYTGAGSGPVICLSCTLPCQAKRQYLLTCKVSRYCLLALHGGTALIRTVTMCVWYFFSTHICSQLFLKGVVDRGIRTIQMLARGDQPHAISTRKHNTSTLRWSNAGPSSHTVFQHWAGTGSTSVSRWILCNSSIQAIQANSLWEFFANIFCAMSSKIILLMLQFSTQQAWDIEPVLG